MLKKMRKKFIIASMGAFGIVITLLAALIIIVNYSVTVSRGNNILHGIIEYEQMKLTHSETDIQNYVDQVTNTCDYINADELDRIFDRFYRMDESRTTQTGGSGIGLSIAQAVTEAHGGKIQANSKNGHDVTFTVTF